MLFLVNTLLTEQLRSLRPCQRLSASTQKAQIPVAKNVNSTGALCRKRTNFQDNPLL